MILDIFLRFESQFCKFDIFFKGVYFLLSKNQEVFVHAFLSISFSEFASSLVLLFLISKGSRFIIDCVKLGGGLH